MTLLKMKEKTSSLSSLFLLCSTLFFVLLLAKVRASQIDHDEVLFQRLGEVSKEISLLPSPPHQHVDHPLQREASSLLLRILSGSPKFSREHIDVLFPISRQLLKIHFRTQPERKKQKRCGLDPNNPELCFSLPSFSLSEVQINLLKVSSLIIECNSCFGVDNSPGHDGILKHLFRFLNASQVSTFDTTTKAWNSHPHSVAKYLLHHRRGLLIVYHHLSVALKILSTILEDPQGDLILSQSILSLHRDRLMLEANVNLRLSHFLWDKVYWKCEVADERLKTLKAVSFPLSNQS